MSRSPFILVPWNQDFMSALVDIVLERGENIGDALFVFPLSRPARYLERLIREDARIAKPCLMPECLTGSQLFQAIWNESHSPATAIGTLDRIGLLLECLRAEQLERPGLIDRIPSDDARAFFPWGRRLAGLFEDCFNNNRVPDGFFHLEDELMPFAEAILSRLGSLYRRYIAALEVRGWTTKGFMAQKSVEALSGGAKPLLLTTRKNIYLAGFYSLNGTENLLFRKLWLENGAEVIIHADPAVAKGRGHWSCAAFQDWQKSWGAPLEVRKYAYEKTRNAPEISYYAGYDLHSQLAFLRSNIHKQGRERGQELEDTAVILPDTTLLLPVLHHIQADDVNISMGYPLSNTALQRFIEAVLSLHENFRDGYYWKDCIRLLRQPYIKMLDDSEPVGGRKLWRELLLKVEHKLRSGRRYIELSVIVEDCLTELEPGESLEKVLQLWKSVRLVCLDMWREIGDLSGLAKTLESLLNLLLERGESIWPRFPIDAECLSRFALSLIPELKGSSMTNEPLPQTALFSIFRELAEAERVPFDAYPLTVLQIMGLLESRLLSFKSIFILDATDDLLPGGLQNDPLLPDSLRAELGLPDSARRQRLTAYYFFRLLQSAEDVHIFWQEGVEPQGVLDGKRLRSRFVEELIWREEQKRGRLLEPKQHQLQATPELPPLLADGPLRRIGSRLTPFKLKNRNIIVTAKAENRLKQILSGPISATRLNNYMRCPAAFYYKELAGLQPTSTVIEDEDPASVGNLFHQVLKDFYTPRLGNQLSNQALSRLELSRLFKNSMRENISVDDMPADAQLMLDMAGERCLRHYLDNQPEETTVQALELPVSAPLSTMDGKTVQLFGYLDRIDERTQADGQPGLVILDYKTGRVEAPSPEIWLADGLWRKLENDEADFNDREFFSQLADAVHDVQLPFYLYLASYGQINVTEASPDQSHFGLQNVCNAGWVELREQGAESFIFPEELPRQERTEIIDTKISLLLDFLLRHLTSASCFFPRTGKRCEYCDYNDICVVLSTQ